MSEQVRIHLEIDLEKTVADEAWGKMSHFPRIEEAWFGFEAGSSGHCRHGADEPHTEGEWCGAWIEVAAADAAAARKHYRKKRRVLAVS